MASASLPAADAIAPASEIQQPAKSKPFWRRSTGVIGTVALLLFITFGSSGAQWISELLDGSHGNGSPSERLQASLTDETPREYVSTDYGFKVNLPGFPEISRKTVAVGDLQVPYVTYARSIKHDTEVYLAMAYDYRAAPVGEESIDLEGALNGIVRTAEGGKLLSSTSSTLGGHPAIDGHFTLTAEGTTYDAFARLTKNGKLMVGVMTMGVSDAGYQVFANSLSFTN